VIVSHQCRCIFVKTGKSGGTSFEIALSKFLGPDDIITAVSRDDEKLRKSKGFRSRQNYRKKIGDYKFKELTRLFMKGIKAKEYWNHMSSFEIKKRIDDNAWNTYHKFTIERNPWDKVVSAFYWDEKGKIEEGKEKEHFDRYVRTERIFKPVNFELYSLDGKPCLDQYIMYDNLEEDLKSLSEKLNLPENVYDVMKSIKAKGNYRKKREHYSSLYDDESIEIVAKAFHREIEFFGFKFEKKTN